MDYLNGQNMNAFWRVAHLVLDLAGDAATNDLTAFVHCNGEVIAATNYKAVVYHTMKAGEEHLPAGEYEIVFNRLGYHGKFGMFADKEKPNEGTERLFRFVETAKKVWRKDKPFPRGNKNIFEVFDFFKVEARKVFKEPHCLNPDYLRVLMDCADAYWLDRIKDTPSAFFRGENFTFCSTLTRIYK